MRAAPTTTMYGAGSRLSARVDPSRRYVTVAPVSADRRDGGSAFRHEAMLYASDEAFVDGTLAFIRDGLEADEPTLVVVDRGEDRALRAELGADAGGGSLRRHEPRSARTPPGSSRPGATSSASTRRRAVGLRGIGEPIWPEPQRRPSWPSASATSRCSTSPSPTRRRSACCAPTTPTALSPAVIEEAGAATRSSRRTARSARATPTAGLEADRRAVRRAAARAAVRAHELAFGAATCAAVRHASCQQRGPPGVGRGAHERPSSSR